MKRIEGECCERKRGRGRGREVVDCGRVGWRRGGEDGMWGGREEKKEGEGEGDGYGC